MNWFASLVSRRYHHQENQHMLSKNQSRPDNLSPWGMHVEIRTSHERVQLMAVPSHRSFHRNFLQLSEIELTCTKVRQGLHSYELIGTWLPERWQIGFAKLGKTF